VFFQKDESYIGIFFHFKFVGEENYKDYPKVVKLFEQGEKALEARDYKQLKQLVNMIYSAMKDDYRKKTFESTPELKNKRGGSRMGLK
jgi:hypothetical protein